MCLSRTAPHSTDDCAVVTQVDRFPAGTQPDRHSISILHLAVKHGISRRRALGLLGMMTTGIAGACGPGGGTIPVATAVNPLIKPRAVGDLTVVRASSELAVGRNRFAMGLIDARNQPISTGAVEIGFFKVDATTGEAEKRFASPATFRAVELLNKGLWVSTVTFPEPGAWGAEAALRRDSAAPIAARLSFEVLPRFSAPGYGDRGPRSQTATPGSVGGDLPRICSNSPPCDLHGTSLDELLANGRPTVLLFATPAFCTSATCAPELTAVRELRGKGYADRVNFHHVEIYRFPFEEGKPVQAVEDWKLPSEPWVFVLDGQGVVRDRFEGAAPVEEIEPALRVVLS